DSAMVEYKTAVRIDPKYVEALTALGNLLRKQGKLEEGTAKLQEAVKYNPKDAPALYALGQAHLKDKKWDAALAVFRKGTLLKQGLASFMRAIEVDSTYAPAYLEAGRLYFRASRPQDAAQMFRAYTGFKPDDPNGYLELGRALAKSPIPGDREEAIVVLEKANEVKPGNCEVAGALGKLYFDKRDNENALKYYDLYALCADTLMSAEEHLKLGTLYVAAKDSAKAVPQLARASQMDSSLAKDANFQLGFLYFARQDHARAIPYFETALKADSTYMPALLNLGLALLAVKQPVAGVDVLRRALAVNPKETRARVWIAQTLNSLDSLPEAFDMYQI